MGVERPTAARFMAGFESLAIPLPDQRDRWTEIAGLFGSAAECVNIAAAAEVEGEVLQRALRKGTLHEAFGIARRAFGETTGYFVISAALSTRFTVFSDDRDSWLDARRGDAVGQIARASTIPDLVSMGDLLSRHFTSPTWTELIAQRDDDFHRWRYESPMVPGIGKTSRWVVDPVARTRTFSFGGSRENTEAADLIDRVCSLAHSALVDTGVLMNGVTRSLVGALPALTRGRVTTKWVGPDEWTVDMDLT